MEGGPLQLATLRAVHPRRPQTQTTSTSDFPASSREWSASTRTCRQAFTRQRELAPGHAMCGTRPTLRAARTPCSMRHVGAQIVEAV